MPVDASIYNNLKSPDSPVTVIGQFASAANAVNQNRLFQQEFAARQAMGPILQHSIGEDGQPDFAKAATLMAQNPATAFKAPEFLKMAIEQQGAQLDNTLKQWNIVQQEQKFFGGIAASVAKLGPQATMDDVTKALSNGYSDMVAAGLGGQKMMDRLLTFSASIPNQNGVLGPAGAQKLQQVADYSLGASETMAKTMAGFDKLDQGGTFQPIWRNPLDPNAAPMMVGPAIPKNLTATERNALVPQQDPVTGAVVSTPRGATPGLPVLNGAGRQEGGPAQAAPQAPMQAPPQGIPAPQMAPTPASAGVQTKMAPGREAFLQGQAQNVVEYQKGLNSDAQQIPAQLARLENLQSLLKRFKSGPGVGVRKSITEFAASVGAPKNLLDRLQGGDPAAVQEFEKYTTQQTMDVLRQAIGGQGRLTNLEFEQFLRTNPNFNTYGPAIEHMLKLTKTVMHMKIAEQKAFDQWIKPQARGGMGRDPEDFAPTWTQKITAAAPWRQVE